VADDRDWFAIELQAGGLYQIDLEGSPTDKGTLPDTYLRGVIDGAGTVLSGSLDDDSGVGYNSRVWLTAETDGLHHVVAAGYGSRTGTYTLTVQQISDDFSAATDTTGRVTVGGQATGRIDMPNDTDWFAVELTEGVAYRVDLRGDSSNGGDLHFTRLLDIRDSNGDPVAATGNLYGGQGFDSRSEFMVTETGTHYVVAAAGGHSVGSYTLQVAELVSVTGSEGDDWLSLPGTGSAGLFGIDGGTGTDMMSFAGLDAGIRVDTHTDRVTSTEGSAPFDLEMDSIENVTGTSHDDVFRGSDRAETFRGLGGRDTFYGSDGGRDVYVGGSGIDMLSYVHSGEGVSVSLLRGRGFAGDARRDVISEVENLAGTLHDDFLWGDHRNNRIEGLHGDDVIAGNGGNDYILAGLGTDVIVFSGNQADYTITRDGIRTDVIDSVMGRDGHDVIGHAEILRFADGDLML
jgi:Ca2+-binding RTX toxin-like protein